MANSDQNEDNKNKNRENQDAENPGAENTGDPKYFKDLPKEGGIRPGNQPSKGGRFGNASVEDGGDVDGSSTGSH